MDYGSVTEILRSRLEEREKEERQREKEERQREKNRKLKRRFLDYLVYVFCYGHYSEVKENNER